MYSQILPVLVLQLLTITNINNYSKINADAAFVEALNKAGSSRTIQLRSSSSSSSIKGKVCAAGQCPASRD